MFSTVAARDLVPGSIVDLGELFGCLARDTYARVVPMSGLWAGRGRVGLYPAENVRSGAMLTELLPGDPVSVFEGSGWPV